MIPRLDLHLEMLRFNLSENFSGKVMSLFLNMFYNQLTSGIKFVELDTFNFVLINCCNFAKFTSF